MTSPPRVLLLATLLPALACQAALDARPLVTGLAPVETIVFRDVTVFPGTEADALPAQDVVVTEGKIAVVRPTGAPPPAGARVIDGRGRTLLPGLIDTHSHLSTPGGVPWAAVRPSTEHNAASQLYAGVTTTYDVSGLPNDLVELKQALAAGEAYGPRLFFTGSSISQKGGHPKPALDAIVPFPLSLLIPLFIVQIDGPDDADAAIERVTAHPVDLLKLIFDDEPTGTPMLSLAAAKKLIDAGRARGLPVFVHVGRSAPAAEIAALKPTALAHMPYREAITEEDARAIGATRVPVTATLHAPLATAELVRGEHRPSALAREMHPEEWLTPITGREGEKILDVPVVRDIARECFLAAPHLGANVQRLVRAGTPILVGTDAPLPGVLPGSAMHEELRALVEVGGMTPAEVLRGATGRAARLFLDDPPFGTVEPGKVADLLLVGGDPLADIRATSHIVAVFQGGREVQRNVPRR